MCLACSWHQSVAKVVIFTGLGAGSHLSWGSGAPKTSGHRERVASPVGGQGEEGTKAGLERPNHRAA